MIPAPIPESFPIQPVPDLVLADQPLIPLAPTHDPEAPSSSDAIVDGAAPNPNATSLLFRSLEAKLSKVATSR